jgi:hypothetical protein
MALIDDVKELCDRLAPLGWRDLLLSVTHDALDIRKRTPEALRQELTKDLLIVDRNTPGFEDFGTHGRRAAAPRRPALSLLYHALAGPLVLRDDEGKPLRGFATPAELDLLENFIFSLAPLSLPNLIRENGRSNVAIAVFSSEYRPAATTVDGVQAGLTFSRTGIARVGTAPARYRPHLRGFWPEDEDSPNNIRVLPARFSAWIAVRKKGRQAPVYPILDNEQATGEDESNRDFWIPVHKLFSGSECIRGCDIDVRLSSRLFNLKIQRIHRALKTSPLPDDFPYVIRDGDIAAWSEELGPGWLVPVVRPRLVEAAMLGGRPLTFRVEPDLVGDFAAVEPPGFSEFEQMEMNPAPSYVHARTRVDRRGRISDLNDEANILQAMRKRSYDAQHYIDYTGEGWVQAGVHGLGRTSLASLAAYVLVAAPDFFPLAGQYELSEWSGSQNIPGQFRNRLWYVSPAPLSETRLPANLQLPGSPFDSGDTTITAVVGMEKPARGFPPIWPQQPEVARASTLPDDAAGIFAPGWDAGVDRTPGDDGVAHLAGYGLGSPFPEDAKLCAALSTFWPAVAPDSFRTFATPGNDASGTVAPLTDEEIGMNGTPSWDGVPGPRIVRQSGTRMVQIASFLNTDYVRQSLKNGFNIRQTARIGSAEYENRMLAISRVYSVAGRLRSIKTTRPRWFVLSFRAVEPGDAELQRAQSDCGIVLSGQVYRVELCRNMKRRVRVNSRLLRFPLRELRFFFVSGRSINVLTRREKVCHWVASRSEGRTDSSRRPSSWAEF